MLNYVWMGLLFIGITVALGTDVLDKVNNKYNNGEFLEVSVFSEEPIVKEHGKSFKATIKISPESFYSFYDESIIDTIQQNVNLTYDSETNLFLIYLKLNENAPKIWNKMASVSGDKDDLTGRLYFNNSSNINSMQAKITFEEISFLKMKEVTNSALDYSGIAVNIAIGLIGIMALWLGVMKIAEEAGLIKIIANKLKPITRLLFPDVPHDHPAMGSMIMNISANMLGLGNAATPFGLKAMEELDKINPSKGVASNAMCTFLAINTAGLTLIPATAIAIRASAGSSDPAIIIGTSVFAAGTATTVAITSSKIFEKFSIPGFSIGDWFKNNIKFFIGFISAIVILTILFLSGIISSMFSFINPEIFKNIIQVISILAIPMLIFIFVGFGVIKKVKIYEVFVEGAKEGFNVAIRIIPYLVAMLVAIGIFRAGGGMDFLTLLLRPVTELIGMPPEALPMALMRPLSGSGSLGIMAEVIAVHGPDSLLGIMVSTFFGSTETTFYVLAVYFGSVNIRKTRHALASGLLADIAGIIAAVFIVNLLFG